jgi:coenzyme F420-reducing hydrogenase gamma subunit
MEGGAAAPPNGRKLCPMKVRLATVWLGGCSGCHMSFLDLDELLIDLADAVEVVYSPVVDVKEYPENVDVCLIEGAVCNEDNLELLHKIRQRTKVLVSFGDCAVTATCPPSAINSASAIAKAFSSAYIENAQDNPSVPKARTASCRLCSSASCPCMKPCMSNISSPAARRPRRASKRSSARC